MRHEFERPLWLSQWKIFVLLSVVSFVFAFAIRMLEYPQWVSNPLCSWNGEYIMGTHDAYYWLAGAKGVGSAIDHPMAKLVRILGEITGIEYGNIGFWLPAIFAGFTAVAALIWGMILGGSWVAMAGAVYATTIPAFYFRTRLSFYDTDIVTLLFPVLISGLIAAWLVQGLSVSWFKDEDSQNFKPTIYDYALPVIAGFMTSFGETWHTDVRMFGFLVVVMGVVLSLICAKSAADRVTLLRGLLIYSLVCFLGLSGVLLVGLLVLSSVNRKFKNNEHLNSLGFMLIALTVVLFFSGAGEVVLQSLYGKVVNYIKPVSESSLIGEKGPVYPGITQSVIEAQNIDFRALFQNIFGNNILGWLGFIAYFGLVLLRPVSILLLPLAIAGVAAVYMGGRFGMFCGLPIGLALAWIPTYLLGKKFSQFAKKYAWVIPVYVIITLLGLNWNLYSHSLAVPIIFPEHVQALKESGKVMPKGSTVWTWWDWGYASMYYTEHDSFANGGKHPGTILYPLALPFTTPSLKQANQFIKYSALQDNNPSKVWEDMTGTAVQDLIKSFSIKNYSLPVKHKQYIVVTWKDVSLLYWILYYGSWNVGTGIGVHPQVMQLFSAFQVNFDDGSLVLKDSGTKYLLSGISILGKNEANVKKYNKNIGPTLVLNKIVSQGFLIDEMSAMSAMVKLLTWNPQAPAISKYFKLVYEGGPFVRVFEVI